ncbi:MAG: hypothetical protein IPJ65_13445 [Archangiaceae bacterium]|nr:hypothetical protein [Archangiaceae bacterium]
MSSNFANLAIFIDDQPTVLVEAQVLAFYGRYGAAKIEGAPGDVPAHFFSAIAAPFPLAIGISPRHTGWVYVFDSEQLTANAALAESLHRSFNTSVARIQHLGGEQRITWFGPPKKLPKTPFTQARFPRDFEGAWRCTYFALDRVPAEAYPDDTREAARIAYLAAHAQRPPAPPTNPSLLEGKRAFLEQHLCAPLEALPERTRELRLTQIRELRDALRATTELTFAGMVVRADELAVLAPALLPIAGKALGEPGAAQAHPGVPGRRPPPQLARSSHRALNQHHRPAPAPAPAPGIFGTGTPGTKPEARPPPKPAPRKAQKPGHAKTRNRAPTNNQTEERNLLLRVGDDGAALGLAIRLGHRGDALALALVLTGARVAGARTGALALTLVDASALHVAGSGLVVLRRSLVGSDSAEREQRGDSRGDHRSLDVLHIDSSFG